MRARKRGSLGRVYVTLALFTVSITGGMYYGLHTGTQLSARHAPQINAIMEIKLEATTAHLWFEEIVSGDRHKDIADVLAHLDSADWYAAALLAGGKNSEGTLFPLDDPALRQDIREVQRKLGDFRRITSERWNSRRSSGVGTSVDQEYDAVFDDYLQLADHVETQIRRIIAVETRAFRHTQMSLIACSIVLALVVGFVFRKDATDRRRAEAESREARRAAEVANRARGEFLANMSHEIRTPMTAILGFADILLEHGNLADAPPERIDAARTIKRNGEYLLGIINDILDLSKIDAGKMAVERIACSPCQIIADVAALVRVPADAKGLPVSIHYVGAIPESIHTDPTRLRQILINVAANAVKFTEVGSVRLITRLAHDGGKPVLQCDIADTGLGLTDEQVGRLFQPFTQADMSTTRQFGGTGLGLSISKHFAQMLGGNVAVVETEPGVGSRFRITVSTGPLDGVKMIEDPTSVSAAWPAPTQPEAIAPEAKLAGCHILFAEDGPDNQRLISHVLKHAGATVTVVENGKLAVDAVLEAREAGTSLDVILMDMQMPVMSGYDATRLLRRKGHLGPIIALTAHAMASDRQKCLDAGCDGYAAKPIDRTTLIELIRSYFGRTHRDASSGPAHAPAPAATA